MSAVALSAEGVWKEFDRGSARASTLTQALLEPLRSWRRGDRFWALRDVSLTLAEGETIGLVGANGSGKTTLLRLVAGLGKPTRGRISRRRRVAAMLSLGETFDPLLTGRENAVTAAILGGYTRKEAARKVDEIIAFSELEEFFDRPVRMYSEGMRLRLAFAVAMTTEPDILVIDEVLAVGDLRFQDKCYRRLEELQETGCAILLASHDEAQVRRVCDRAVWLANGRMRAAGTPDDVFAAYREAMVVETERRAAARRAALGSEERPTGERFGTLEVEIDAVRIEPQRVRHAGAGGDAPVRIEIDLEPHTPVDEPIVGVSLHRVSDGLRVLDVSTAADGASLGRLDSPRTVALSLDRLDAAPGSYRFDVGVYARNWSHVYDYHWQAYPLEIVGGVAGGTFGPSRRWVSR